MLDAVCAGHICLDLTPRFAQRTLSLRDVFAEGRLTAVGDMEFTPGGSVTNTGVALSRLGFDTALMGKTGDDDLGKLTAKTIRELGGSTRYLTVSPEDSSSYSVVLAVPGHDRIFLHHAGANNTFVADDIDWDAVADARLFHFGYTPLMRKMYEDDGTEQQAVMRKAKELGATTSLDLAMPDMSTEAGQVNWRLVLERTLPYTDVFAPSIEELLIILAPEEHRRLRAQYEDILDGLQFGTVHGLAGDLLAMGARIVVIKCGTRGYYLRTAGASRLEDTGRAGVDPEVWGSREFISGIFPADRVVSTTGAGDTSIAGFLAGLLMGLTPEEAVETACACGAFCVTEVSGVGGIPTYAAVREKIDGGWEKLPVDNAEPFCYADGTGMYCYTE